MAKGVLYKKEISELYCPELDSRANLDGLTVGLLFPLTDQGRLWEVVGSLHASFARSEYASEHMRLIGREPIDAGDIAKIFPTTQLLRAAQ